MIGSSVADVDRGEVVQVTAINFCRVDRQLRTSVFLIIFVDRICHHQLGPVSSHDGALHVDVVCETPTASLAYQARVCCGC